MRLLSKLDARDAFQRALALSFFLAFCSFYAGSLELVGTRGVEPLQTIIEQRRVPGDLLESFSGTPTLIWLLDSLGVEAGAAADVCCLLGAALAAAATLGLLGGCTPLFVALSLLYLAVIAPLASATARGSSLPWAELPADGLLLEAAFAASLWAPLWPRGKEEEEEDHRDVGEASEDGGSSNSRGKKPAPLSAPALAPAFLLRWVAAKNAFFRGLCRLRKSNGSAAATVLSASSSSSTPPSSLIALVADIALAPLALSPARLPRLVAAAALLASWAIDVASLLPFSAASRSASTSPLTAAKALWTCLLRPTLVLPLFHAGILDSSSNEKGSSESKSNSGEGRLKTAARILVPMVAAVPALLSALGVLSRSSGSSFEASLSKYAPHCLAAAGMTMLASLAADVLRSMSSAGIGLDEDVGGEAGGGENEERGRPMTLSTRREKERGREEKSRRRRRAKEVEFVRGAHEPALVGAISLMLFCAGCFEVSSSLASSSSPRGTGTAGGAPGAAAAAAAEPRGGCSGGPGCGGGPAALVVARRLSWLARPWRATGPSLQSMLSEEGAGRGRGASSVAVAVEVRSDCRDDDEGKPGLWSEVSPRSRSSRVAAALSSLSPHGGEGGDDSAAAAPPPPWLDHLLYRLVSDPRGPVAASFFDAAAAAAAPAGASPPPCAARAVTSGGNNGEKMAWASFSAAEAADASSPASERLARHGWGPLVGYEAPSRFGGAVAAAAALPRKLFENGGGFNVAGAVAAVSVVCSATALAIVRRRSAGSPPEATASKKRD